MPSTDLQQHKRVLYIMLMYNIFVFLLSKIAVLSVYWNLFVSLTELEKMDKNMIYLHYHQLIYALCYSINIFFINLYLAMCFNASVMSHNEMVLMRSINHCLSIEFLLLRVSIKFSFLNT